MSLLPVLDRGDPGPRRHARWAAPTPAGPSTRRTARRRRPRCSRVLLGVFILGFSSILTGLNFIVTVHTLRAPGHQLDAAAAVRLGDLRDQHHPGARDPGPRPHGAARRHREDRRVRPLRRDQGRRPGAVPAPVLVLLAPGRLHHDAAGDGRDQRGHRRLRPQERVRLQDDRVLVAGHRVRRLLRLGPPHVRVGPVDRSTTAPSRSSRCSSGCSPPSRSSTGWRRSTAAPSRSRRRSSTSAASSSSSCSAA